ncbi:LysE family translocator [Roseovarius sp. SCSIO 43702]|uniref:LysE family translocator n=1 Tax=Roseovarius sp. SCSIO 43702 TaxID=2823043 RepID=UPI001C73B066|nr:LysE family translocator [Roseovarius sp. SCSIO 43702]QYX57647.1 LysE family translocator [Roseovarius sp. SCSIO 43702]
MPAILSFLPGFAAAYAILVVAAASPGPAVAMLLGIATGQGRAPALVASAGIATGSVLLNLGTLAGVGLILAQAAWAMAVLRVIGGAYLLWLAWGAFRKAMRPPSITVAPVAARGASRHFLAGFLLQVTNPKAIVFWIAIASVGATTGGGAGVIALFVAGAFAISFACHGAWALVLSSGPIRRGYAVARRWIEAGLGAFFTVAAVRLAV